MKHKVTMRKQCLLEQVDACCVQTKTMNSNTQHTHTSSCSSWQIPARLSIARHRRLLRPNTRCRSAAPVQPRRSENTRNEIVRCERWRGAAQGGAVTWQPPDLFSTCCNQSSWTLPPPCSATCRIAGPADGRAAQRRT